MNKHHNLNLNIYASFNKLNASRANEVNLVAQSPNNPKPIREKSSATPLSLLLIYFLGIWLALVFIISKVRKVLPFKSINRDYHKPPPCRTCRFFVNHPYLKCAVHPSIVLTELAYNCSDYKLDDDFFIKKRKHR
jgi:hypothetical protein